LQAFRAGDGYSVTPEVARADHFAARELWDAHREPLGRELTTDAWMTLSAVYRNVEQLAARAAVEEPDPESSTRKAGTQRTPSSLSTGASRNWAT
jgi:hypothetical protein